jgi:DedD protein
VVQSDDPIAGFANAKINPPPAAPAPSASTQARVNHWVQIGAFGNEAKARDMASQLRGKGYPAVTEVVRGSGGELYRVRVGPLETKESAGRARDNLVKSGFEGAVVQ